MKLVLRTGITTLCLLLSVLSAKDPKSRFICNKVILPNFGVKELRVHFGKKDMGVRVLMFGIWQK
jgi:hypothetical protein